MTDKKSHGYFVGGVIIGILGAICFSTKAVLVKVAYRETDVDAVTLLALRMLFSLPFFIATAYLSSAKSDNVKFTGKQWMFVAVVGCLGYYGSSLLDFIGLQYISAGIERLVLFIYPTLVLIISAIAFRVKVKPLQWVAVLVTYVGLFIAYWGEASFQATDANFFKGTTLIFFCAITYALYIVGSGQLIPVIGPSKFNSYAMSFAAAAVLIHFLVTSDTSLFGLSPEVYLYSFLMAIISTVVPSYLVAESIKRIGSNNTAIVASIGPVSTIIQAYFVLSEPIHALQLIGTTFIILGVLMIGHKKKQVPESSR